MDPIVAEWVRLARGDARTARLALDGGECENALYHCQQALEKALKARIQERTDALPPRVHNLPNLSRLAGVWEALGEAQQRLLTDVDQYAIAGRYGATTGSAPLLLDESEVRAILSAAEEVLAWLLRALR